LLVASEGERHQLALLLFAIGGLRQTARAALRGGDSDAVQCSAVQCSAVQALIVTPLTE